MAKLGVLLVLLVVIWVEVQASSYLKGKSTQLQHQVGRIKRVHNPNHGGLVKRFMQLGRREESACQKQGACGGNGVCIEYTDGYYCSCDEGWGGEDCDIEDVCASNTTNPCQNNGFCYLMPALKTFDDPQVNYYCACDMGYVGQNCEYECAMDRIYSDFQNELFSEDPVDTHDEAVALCSGLVDKLVKDLENSLDAKDGKNCHCERHIFDNMGQLFADKKAWIEQQCARTIFYEYDNEPNMCSDKDIMDCFSLVNDVNMALYPMYNRKRKLVPAATQKLIDEGVACMTKLQTKDPWPAECSSEKSQLLDTPPKKKKVPTATLR